MSMAFLERVLGQPGEKDAVIWKDRCFSYSWLRDRIGTGKTKSGRRGFSQVRLQQSKATFRRTLLRCSSACCGIIVSWFP